MKMKDLDTKESRRPAPFRAPCDIIIDAIEDDEKRDLVHSLFFFTLNTRGGVPSDAARWLASMTTETLTAYRVSADRQNNELREREQSIAWARR